GRGSARRGRGKSCELERGEEVVEGGDSLGVGAVRSDEPLRVPDRQEAAAKALAGRLAQPHVAPSHGPDLTREAHLPPHGAAGGFGTSTSPLSPISNTATSLVDPKRFFTARSTRSAWAPSPSK